MTTTNKDKKKLGLYIHIPFCLRKCAYCDFLSFENDSAVIHKVYVKALMKEIEYYGSVYGNDFTVNTVFLGGGTPSILLQSMTDDIVKSVKYSFDVSVDSEITIEANPKTLTETKLSAYLESGINRLSIGAQSFNDFLLKILSRVHLSEDTVKNFKMARAAGFKNINIDLIFGVPQQTQEVWKDTLLQGLALEPEHISFYSLQIEKGTKFYELFVKGPYEKASEKLDREMYHYGLEELKTGGYDRYEISNAAKPGYECRHNIKYWTMEDYIGVGIGAHSYIKGIRRGNITDFDMYIEKNLENPAGLQSNEKILATNRENSFTDEVSEYMFTGLRMADGISIEDFEKRFKKPLKEIYYKEWRNIEKYITDKLLINEAGRLSLSDKGIDISNKIMSEFMISAGRPAK